MHVAMKTLCDQVANDPANAGLTRVEYGCIIYGDIDKMASAADSTDNWVPTNDFPMDWYGIDVYYEPDTGSNPSSTHPLLSTYGLVSDYMNGFLQMAQGRGGSQWMYTNDGYRMLTFFTHSPPAPHSVTWEHVADAAPGSDHTIDALNYIQATYG